MCEMKYGRVRVCECVFVWMCVCVCVDVPWANYGLNKHAITS